MPKYQFHLSYGRAVNMAQTALNRHLGNLMKANELPITPEQFSVLTHLWRKDGLAQQELACLTDRNRANVTRIIDILEREGIVERKDNATDRRVFNIFLTDLGKKLEEAAAACAQQTLNDALQGVTDDEIQTCMKVLNLTLKNLE